uniref:histidine kinase n=1 Tax=candidate division WOR-3 bacterium TaxID=2052148 RepID=A0A7C4YG16_UNCW3
MDIEFEKLWRISRELHLSLDLDDSLCRILTALTAGEGLAFNYAILMEKKEERLKPRLKIGPETKDEAFKIWAEMSKVSSGLEELLDSCQTRRATAKIETDDFIYLSEIPEHLLSDGSIKIDEPASLPSSLQRFINYFPSVIVPLKSESGLLGLIIADNRYTHNPITEKDLKTLDLYAAIASNVIERSILFENVKNKQTELENALKELKESQMSLMRLEKFATIGEIASTFAHELRTPIAIIGGYSEKLLKKFELPQDIKNYIQIISKTSKRVELIIQNLSDYIRSPVPDYKEFELNKFLDNIVSFIDIELEKKKIQLKKDYKEEINIIADSSLLEHAFLNVLRNSIDAIENNGEIIIKSYRENGLAVVEIKDNGSGIPEEIMKNLFIPFHTLKTDGLGLGLAITKKIIILHNGKIDVESKEGEGTIVRIKIPLRREENGKKNSLS